jgi:hypothetical protein
MEKICEVSNPAIVLKELKKYYDDGVDLYLSTSKNKKYMVFDEDGKKIHFGDLRFSDWTKHKDKQKRNNFRNRNRNRRWKDADKYTPSHLSYYLLW